MNDSFCLRLEGRVFGADDIRQPDTLAATPVFRSLSDYGQATLAFCHAWLRGQKRFEQATSGSTGKPKIMPIHREQMEASAAMTARALRLRPRERALVCLGTNYIAGKMMLVRAMEVGMEAIVLPPSSQPLEALDIAVDFTALVPLQLQTMLSEPAGQNIDQLNAMRVLLLGGAPLGHALESKIRKRLSVAVYHSYGMTETVSHIALRRVNGPGADSLYRVLEGVEIKTDERGCLMIRGAVSSYAWLQTNDLVEIIAADQFRWIGRADFVINSGGVKIHVEPLERKIEQLLIEEGWSISFILGSLPDEKLGQQLVMLLEGDTHSLPGNEEIRQLLRARLPVYEVPRALFVLPALLRTASGKIDRKANFRLINS